MYMLRQLFVLGAEKQCGNGRNNPEAPTCPVLTFGVSREWRNGYNYNYYYYHSSIPY